MKRFWDKVFKTDTCWLWVGLKNYKGYGIGIMINRRQTSAHRQSYEIHKGPIPKGLHVCHSCDVRHCVNPDHLWLGTNAENIKDRDQKGRRKVSGEQVLDIRSRPISFGSQTALAKEFNITIAAINLILKRKNWKHI